MEIRTYGMVGHKMRETVKYRVFTIADADLPREIREWDEKLEQYRARVRDFMKKYEIAYCFFNQYGQVKSLAVIDPEAHKWCLYVRQRPVEVRGRRVFLVEPNAKLKAGQSMIEDLNELNKYAVTQRNKEMAILKHYGLEYSVWWKKTKIETKIQKKGDDWYIVVPSTIASGGAVGWGLSEEYKADGALKEISIEEYEEIMKG